MKAADTIAETSSVLSRASDSVLNLTIQRKESLQPLYDITSAYSPSTGPAVITYLSPTNIFTSSALQVPEKSGGEYNQV